MFELHINKNFSVKNDILSGLTVALALVPEAVAFAFVAGVQPLVGLYAAFIVCLITSIAGGRPGMISGATGSMAVVMVALVARYGVEYLFATIVLTGILQILAGIFRLGKFIRIVPHPVMLGFVNGLAIVIFLAQLKQFSLNDVQGWLHGTLLQGSSIDLAWIHGTPLYWMLGLVVITMLIVHFLPRFTKIIPSTLAAILILSIGVYFLNIDTRTVGDVAHIKGGLPSFHIPMVPLNWHTLAVIFPFALILAAVGLIESLLTLRLIDEITETRGRSNKECIGQGLANTVAGFFSSMGGCAMIGQSMINIESGGRSRLSGITAAVCLLAFILVLSPLIEQIPVAVLVGIMFMVVLGTFEWCTFRIINKIPKSDALIIILVSLITVFTDLAMAVVIGVIVSALIFAWEHAKHVQITREPDQNESTVYSVRGALFFGSSSNFLEQFNPKNDRKDVIIDFMHARVCDHSGLEAIDTLAERYMKYDIKLHLIHLSPECKKLLTKAGDLVEVNVIEDPKYLVADDSVD
ncbi:SulP family inorganic anion transporter [Dongshaea marina]|uniref:SulP family inorganic anion transporter n=1 Tax=Dongshaea marina TaxID=2047966 RepID=UPI000D3E7596|nr:SulP family inorganic anion transporter [Dongshaea marina]